MAIPTIEGSSGVNAAQTQQAAVRKTAAGASRAAGGPPAGGAGKPSATAGSASSSESTSYNKKDTNKDGVVSALEELTYDMKHPAARTGSLLDVKA